MSRSGGVRKHKDTRNDKKQLQAFVANMLSQKSLGVAFHKYMMMYERMDTEISDEITSSIVEYIVNPNTEMFEPKRFSMTQQTPRPSSKNEFLLFETNEFWTFFHVNRKTLRIITSHVHNIALDVERGLGDTPSEEVLKVSVTETIQLCLWYLRNADDSLEEIRKLFSMESVEFLEQVLIRGLRLLTYLKEHSGMCWYTKEELAETAEAIHTEYRMSDIIGAISHRIFTTVNRKRLLLQIVCNENRVLKEGIVTFDTRPHVAIAMENEFYWKLKYVPSGLKIVGNEHYIGVPKPLRNKDLILTPNKKDRYPMIMEFSEVHQAILRFAEQSMFDLSQRFPRLDKLHDAIPDAIMAACVLYNYCLMYDDQAPFI